MITNKNVQIRRYFFAYGLGFLLLWEWLLPLPVFSDTGNIHVFILFIAFSFIVTFLQLRYWISVPLQFIAMLVGLHLLYFNPPLFTSEWLVFLGIDIAENMMMLASGNWYHLSDLFRSLLFFILLAIISYLLFYWIVYAKRILFFLLFTVSYIAVLDTFTEYDATFAMIRTFIIGFLLLGILQKNRLLAFNRVIGRRGVGSGAWVFVLACVVTVAALFAISAPKYEPQWADPVPAFQQAFGGDGLGDGVGGTQRIGYGDNDEQLGGGFIYDESPVLYVEAEEGHYWRGESKDFYTGKGWRTTTPGIEAGGAYLYSQTGYVEHEATVTVAKTQRFTHLFYPGQLLRAFEDDPLYHVAVDVHTGRADSYIRGERSAIDQYDIQYESPQFEVELLRASDGRIDDFPEIERYLQLPDELPERVVHLAEEIVSEYDNRYDKARAVERYFAEEGFTYETMDVAVPDPDQDYVDQFLFETRQGYCDNFSTSMVVLLRAVDIPARWVKGFTEGEVVDWAEQGRRVYEVTNANAHSWVEVFFPGVGWVPFEPTSGFGNPFEFVLDDEERSSDESELTSLEDEQEAEEAFAAIEEKQEDERSETSWYRLFVFASVIALTIVLLTVVVVKRRQLGSVYVLYRMKKRHDEDAFVDAYQKLLWLLSMSGVSKRNEETLREFASRVDRLFATDAMTDLTVVYEKIYYGGKPATQEWSNKRTTWRNLIKKIGS
ncbi:transglutaminase TgpA family protein [Desertibacillus haloalkaliphilus]|uniref:transglutaminase TgpA family protein n=1 Tax=Desertibacillus haloalkaliphilus TaxID=1328930 RepID=UPI001C27D7F7|nr:transglutaminaseTgpA domain-containing protein [Desertibacillus haloalkaliphilus]MBU8906359.1 DUF3488 and transglutaminase-like domain-containing protein [Desertibacillus haloalkaliphilus]